MDRILSLTLVSVSMLAMAGCAGVEPPNWFNPGPSRYQQLKAQQIDPYPDTDMAPEMVGVRPRDYQQPRSEPVKAQWNFKSWWGRLPF